MHTGLKQLGYAVILAAVGLTFTGCGGDESQPKASRTVDFGVDTGWYTNDGECDDPRFVGADTTTEGAPLTDASDCRALWQAGSIQLRSDLNARARGLSFGDDSGEFVMDGDCDDPRFDGYNTTDQGSPFTDATDCRVLWDTGLISLRPRVNEGLPTPDFGDDSGDYANDGDCDDPRFQGYNATSMGTARTDATDCRMLWDAGLIAPSRGGN